MAAMIHYEDDRITLCHGDALEVLRQLPEDSLDSVVTDPPYGLEFMGKDWDGADGFRRSLNQADSGRDNVFGRTSSTSPEYRVDNFFQQWCQAWAEQCLRVLKPGGHLLAFGGSRTFHRLTCAIEDAGFEIRDSISWLYGCLTADAEILTATGWIPGIDVSPGDRVAQWDAATGKISLAAIQEIFRAPWDGPMRVLRNADTDQVLTPNHRVYYREARRQSVGGVRKRWYDQKWAVKEAGQVSTWNGVQLPVAGHHDGEGVGGEDYAALLGWVWTEGGFDPSGTGVRISQSSVNADKVAEIAALLDRLGQHKRYDRVRTYRGRQYTETTWFISGELASRVRDDLPGKRPTYGLLWRMTQAEKLALLRSAMLGDGSGWGGKSEQFHQKHRDDLEWMQTLLALVGRAGKVQMRPDRDCGVVYLRNRSTTELQARHLRDRSESYQGQVWCVRVPTGAFVARRNGKVFITGNSGFPKSMDVSKAIDGHITKGRSDSLSIAAVNEERPGEAIVRPSSTNGHKGFVGSESEGPRVKRDTPATEDAQRWQGWGTALKPAWEPIIVARKPLIGTVANNVLAHGTGALNIDGCRVEYEKGGSLATNPSLRESINGGNGGNIFPTETERRTVTPHQQGRWPTNVVLDESQAGVLDEQTGTLTSGKAAAGGHRRKNSKGAALDGGVLGGSADGSLRNQDEAGSLYGDSGGASRYFPTFKYQAKAPKKERPTVDGVGHPTVKPLELMRWLVKLVTPPGGYVLDPFAGSGTTGEAALTEGFRCVLIERDDTYLPLIMTRLDRCRQESA